ncbi:hypothetical protein PC110_g14090 [Phytophthora cactorum]|uniref:PiggyBac transposable element-derived protein domain-containing protein n=1 Tax=Phytophthora cactorum TaxID=29920 RepID=A0A329RYA4_9STRA|nr:hypothetical protein PC110_g14090 [Phytophthora cactorum]
MTEDTIHRNIKGVGSTTVTCPTLASDYQHWMGGVDVHDQLRSSPTRSRRRFGFKSIISRSSCFRGFLDLALVIAYITYKQTCLIKRRVPKDRGNWYLTLHKQFLQLKADDFVEAVAPTPSPATRSRKRRRLDGHIHTLFDDWVTVSGVQKRRQRSCKTQSASSVQRHVESTLAWPRPATKYGMRTSTAGRQSRSLDKRVVLRRSGKVGSLNPTRCEILHNLDSGDQVAGVRLDGGEAEETEATV